MYTTLFRHVVLPVWERFRKRTSLEHLAELERSQFLSHDELIAMQVTRLRSLLVDAAAHVPAQRARMAAAGFDPTAVRNLDTLAQLPLLTRADLQADVAAFTSTSDGAHVVVKSTSGSTGTPFRFAYNYESEMWRQAVKLRGWGWAGYVPGKKTLYYWGPAASVPSRTTALKIGADRALRRELYLDCARQSEAEMHKAVAAVRAFRPEVFVCFTQAAVSFARFINQHGVRDWPAMRIVCGAEALLPADRPVLEAAFGDGKSVFETYGCREFMLLASECEMHQGLHQSMETLLIEIVDDDGRPVAPGTLGQVVVTDLFNTHMPLIRYVSGDLAIAAPPTEKCGCGRALQRLHSIQGRKQDMLRAPDGTTVPGIVITALFAALGGRVRQFQAIQRRNGNLELSIVPGPEFEPSVVALVEGRIRPYLNGIPMSVNVVDSVQTLPSGKRRFIVVET